MAQQTAGTHHSQRVAQGENRKTFKNSSKDGGDDELCWDQGQCGVHGLFSGKSQVVQSCTHTTQPVPSLLDTELGRSSHRASWDSSHPDHPPLPRQAVASLCPARRPALSFPFPLTPGRAKKPHLIRHVVLRAKFQLVLRLELTPGYLKCQTPFF